MSRIVDPPKIGDKIWVGPGDFENGGWSRVSQIKFEESQNAHFVSVEVFPNISYNWNYLSKEQSRLKKSYPRKATIDWEYLHIRQPISHNWYICPVCKRS